MNSADNKLQIPLLGRDMMEFPWQAKQAERYMFPKAEKRHC
jgi:hypothetical protein